MSGHQLQQHTRPVGFVFLWNFDQVFHGSICIASTFCGASSEMILLIAPTGKIKYTPICTDEIVMPKFILEQDYYYWLTAFEDFQVSNVSTQVERYHRSLRVSTTYPYSLKASKEMLRCAVDHEDTLRLHWPHSA